MVTMPDQVNGISLVGCAHNFELPILEIKIGPAQDQDTAAAAVRTLLAMKGRAGIDVSTAEIPYR